MLVLLKDALEEEGVAEEAVFGKKRIALIQHLPFSRGEARPVQRAA